ncbi:MAG: FAD-dependent oxidoreductase [bacterium]
MPALSCPEGSDALQLPPRSARIAGEADVLVVGGGPAGLGAALGAAMAGAQVILAERYGFLGGNATAALVTLFVSFHTHRPCSEPLRAINLWPVDHGPGEPTIGGVLEIFLKRMVERGGAIPPSLNTGYVTPFDPEIFKLVALELLDDAGIHFLLHSLAADVISSGKVEGVAFETKSGPVVVKARMVIDCTGDGDVAVKAGAVYDVGREGDGLVQPMTLMFRMDDFEKDAFEAYVKEHPDQWHGVHGLQDLISKAIEAGELDLPREDILFFGGLREHEVIVNSTRITRVLGKDVWDLTYAEAEGRRQMHQIAAFLRRYVPGFERSYILQSGVNIGVRETRRIRGDYQLTAEDILQARTFDDVIARGSYPLDIHNPTGVGTVLKRLPAGAAYDIPLRCLLPVGIDNLLVAGRCISGTHEAHSSYRVMPIAMATGQAAGVCAALASLSRKSTREVFIEDVQCELIRQGANLRELSWLFHKDDRGESTVPLAR